jgi:predicted nuclease with TOPRIM domain
MEELWSDIAQNVELLKSVEWSDIPEEGLALNGDVFASMNFVETENLKYKPELVSETVSG